MKLDNIYIWWSPLTKRVYVGRVRVVNGRTEAKDKVDRTNEFISVMIQFLKEYGDVVEITEQNSGKKYVVTLKEDIREVSSP